MVLNAAAPPLDPAERVLDAAGRLFYERGVQAVGMDAIRDASGVSLKRLYALFPAKEALVEAVLLRRARQVGAELARASSGAAAARAGAAPGAASDDPRERILAIFALLGTWFGAPGYRGCEFINAFGELGATSDRVAAVARAHKQEWRELFGELVREAGGPPRLAGQLALLVNGAMVSAAMVDAAEAARDARDAAAVLLAAELPPPVG